MKVKKKRFFLLVLDDDLFQIEYRLSAIDQISKDPEFLISQII